MKNNLIFLFCLLSFCLARAETDSQIIKKFIPQKYIVDDSGIRKPVGDEVIYDGEIHQWVDLDGKGTNNYLVVGYRGYGAEDPDTLLCQLIAIKVEGKKLTAMSPTTLQMNDEITGCFKIETYDFDGDKKPELLIKRVDGRVVAAPALFKWDGSKLVSITPTKLVSGQPQNVLDQIEINPTPVNGKILIKSISEDPNAPTEIYSFTNGDYILTVKNLSKHNRTVRAEVYVNGVLVLKPKDFCKFPKASVRWIKHLDDDDEDDRDSTNSNFAI